MSDFLKRTTALLGEDAVEKLRNSSVLLFGVGGVGGYVAEALARAGVGRIAVCDGDVISESNLNRQILALNSTIGINKATLSASRIKDINPDCKIEVYPIYYNAETESQFAFESFDYVADAIDNVTSKLLIIRNAKAAGVRVISCMGTGNRYNANFKVSDISKTTVCPLARVMRAELKKRGITEVKVVYSDDLPIKSAPGQPPASISFVPPVAGFTVAGEIVRDILGF